MEVSNFKKNLIENSYPIFLFIFFLIYYSFWIKYNFNNVSFNTNDLNTAIEIYNYKPYLSFFLNNIFLSEKLKIFMGFCFFPSLVSVILFLIFKKILANNIWSLSLTFLSIIATENYPFINFLYSLFSETDITTKINLYENFEVMGFPIPSFSVFFFCLTYYFTITSFRLSRFKLYFISFLWIAMFHFHPIDGFIGNFYWISLLLILFFQKKIQISTKDLLILSIIFLINIFVLTSQLNFESLQIEKTQNISHYNILFYFILPIVLISGCLILLKIDLYEFYQKFLNIYLIMFIEIVLIVLSLNGIGFELQMLENRITMFLLHYLYYVPVIYYLSKDEIFYLNSTNKNSYSGRLVILLYYVFNKYKNLYLLFFLFLILVYLILSIKI